MRVGKVKDYENEKKYGVFDFINCGIMLLVLFVTFYPFIYIISISFSDTMYIVQNQVSFYPKGFNMSAYKMLFQSPRIPRAYLNTIIYTTSGVFVNLFLTIITAYPISKKHLRGKKYIMLMILITMFFNGGIIPNYLLVRSLKMIDTIWALIIPNAIWTFELLILKNFFENVPNELNEAAKIDGASEFRVLFTIFIPLSKAAIAAIALFYTMGHWNSFFNPMIYLNSMDKLPLQVILRDMLIEDTAKTSSTIGEYMSLTPIALKNATIFISLLPMLMLYPYIQRFFTKGLMLGAVKG